MLTTPRRTGWRPPDARSLGPTRPDLTRRALRAAAAAARRAESFPARPEQVAGIGNAYIHDILFLARLHPLRKSAPWPRRKSQRWHRPSGRAGPSLEKGGAFYELDLYGQKGGFHRR